MFKRILGTLVLLAAASATHAYQVRAYFAGSPFTESSGTQTVTVEAQWGVNDDPSQCTLNVDVSAGPFTQPVGNEATPGQDYLPVSTTVSLTVDEINTVDSDTFAVTVIDDDLVEGDQEFTARITNVQFVGCIGTPVADIDPSEDFFPIVDDDIGSLMVSLEQPVVLVEEDGGSVMIRATLTGAESIEGDFEVVANWVLFDGSATLMLDYGTDEAGGLFVFDRNTQTQTLVIPILDDAEVEELETFQVSLSGAQGMLMANESFLSVGTGIVATTVQIVDDDGPGTPVFATDTYQANESAGNATIALLRLGGTNGPLTAYYQVLAGTATADVDFTAVSGTVTWADGDETNKTFDVPILDDLVNEGNETVLIRLSTDPDFGSYQETVLTLIDDDGPTTISFAAAAAGAEEEAEEVVVTLIRGGSPVGAVSVTYATSDGTAIAGEDYVAAAGTVTWADGDAADKTIVIALIADGEEEEAEDFAVNLTGITGSATIGANASITITIGPNDAVRDIGSIGGLTPNQRELAQWFDRTCERIDELDGGSAAQRDLAEVCSALRSVGTDDAAVREALEAINPEELLVSTSNALRLTSMQHGNLSHRLNALRNGATGVSLVGLNLDVHGQQIAGHALQEMFDKLTGGGASADEGLGGRWGAFVNGRIATGDQDETDDEAGFGFDLYSVTVGVDYRVRPNLIVGVSAGFGEVDTDFDGGGGMDIDSWNSGLYLTYFREDTFYLDALATYGKNDYQSERRIDFGSVQRTGFGKTDGSQWSIGVGAGWDYSRGPFTFGPHFGAYYFDVDVDAFVETGALGLSVAVDDQGSKSFTLNGGGHVSYAWLTDWGVLVPNARVDWVRELEDGREELSFRFVNDPFVRDPGDPSPVITLRSKRPDPNYLIWSLGLSAQFVHGFSGFVNYQAYTGYGDLKMSEWSLGARWEKTF